MEQIEQTAEECKRKVINYTKKILDKLKIILNDRNEQSIPLRRKNEFNEIDLNKFQGKLNQLKEELNKTMHVTIEQQQSTAFIDKIFVHLPLDIDTTWKQYAKTFAGGNESNQLYLPHRISVDNQTIYIVDYGHHRILKWRCNATSGRIVAGDMGQGNQTNELYCPTDMVIDHESNSLIIADQGNKRVMRYSRQNTTDGEILISHIDCFGLAIDKSGSFYVSDWKKNEVRRWRRGEKGDGTIVAGGNGRGNGQGSTYRQLSHPQGVIADRLGPGIPPTVNFFPYGINAGDSIFVLYNNSEGPLRLPYQFTYVDNFYDQMWITKTGLISFLKPLNSFTYPQSFSSVNDTSFIAGYWHASFANLDNSTKNQVYYQIYKTNRSLLNSTMEVFDKTSEYVRNFFPQQRLFQAKMVIVATWYYINIVDNVTDQLNNTFQIVLTTDEDRSFAFFLYHDLQWSNPWNNINSSYEARAGFHSTNRNVSEMLPYSGTNDIINLVNESNVNVSGLFAFRIDADKINAGGCHENTSTISFRPRIGSQLGSTALTIYGPCFTSQTRIKCRFNLSSIELVDGIMVDQFRAICLTPFASQHGSISVSISIDNGLTFASAGLFTYAPLQFGSDQVTIQIENKENLLFAGQYVTLKWDFSEMMINTFPNGTKIDIEIREVTVNDQSQSQLQKSGQFVTLASDLNLTNFARIQLPNTISYMSTGFIQIFARLQTRSYGALNTGLLISRSPSSSASKSCQEWIEKQPEPYTWNGDGLLQCPMTRQQAIAAGRCCYKSDQQCYQGSSNPNNCWLHRARSGRDEPSAVECYTPITTNRYGAAAECCYDNTTMLITRGTGAGTDDRYATTISPVKHFVQDTLPYLQCCIMSNDSEMCNKYIYYRPSRRGSNTMGETGRMWGDPHFGTLDGTSYTFNGYGEYTYLAISNSTSPLAAFDVNNQSYVFISQIRTIPILSNSNNATVTKGFAARSSDAKAEPVSVTISTRQRLILRRGRESLEFEENSNVFNFPELIITRLDGNNNRRFSLSWTIGVTIEINLIKMTSPSEQLVLDVAAAVAGIFRERTYGLLGTYDGITDNDLRSQNGSIVRSNDSLERIHKDFGVTWAIDPVTSLFYYESNQSASFFHQQNSIYIPSFTDPTANNNPIIRSVCRIDAMSSPSSWNVAQRTCYYDLSMTRDIDFAKTSLHAGNELLSIRENQKNPPIFLSSLPISLKSNRGFPVNFLISASSEYPSHLVELSVLHQPKYATFDRSTGRFRWIAIAGEHFLSIEARDTTYNLTAKHDIQFYVNRTGNGNGNDNGNGSNNQFNRIDYLLLIFVMVILVCH